MALRNELREHVCRKDFRDRPEAEDRLTIRFGLVAGSRLSEPRDKGVFSTNHRDDETRCETGSHCLQQGHSTAGTPARADDLALRDATSMAGMAMFLNSGARLISAASANEASMNEQRHARPAAVGSRLPVRVAHGSPHNHKSMIRDTSIGFNHASPNRRAGSTNVTKRSMQAPRSRETLLTHH